MYIVHVHCTSTCICTVCVCYCTNDYVTLLPVQPQAILFRSSTCSQAPSCPAAISGITAPARQHQLHSSPATSGSCTSVESITVCRIFFPTEVSYLKVIPPSRPSALHVHVHDVISTCTRDDHTPRVAILINPRASRMTAARN